MWRYCCDDGDVDVADATMMMSQCCCDNGDGPSLAAMMTTMWPLGRHCLSHDDDGGVALLRQRGWACLGRNTNDGSLLLRQQRRPFLGRDDNSGAALALL